MSDPPSSDALHKAAFLGPKGENADELERLLLEVLRDHVFWRRNFHPRDPRLIDERDKRTEAFDDMSARLRDELSKILAELKRAAPLYSPRQVAHIVSDPSLPAFVGYFAGLLYNQNNVVAEVSPETVREERAYFKALAEMVGYPTFLPETLPRDARTRRPSYSWGHLCSGGTVANLETLWIARNIRLYPLAVRLVAHQTDAFASLADLEVTTAIGERAALDALSTWRLSNLPIDAITDLHLRIKATLREGPPERAEAFQEALPSVRRAGLASFLLQYNRAFPDDPARLPKVFISQATHYCWQKNMDVVGLGADALETIPVDDRIRLDTDALRERLHECIENQQPVLGVVSIVGTTEEGAIDPLHEIEAVRREVGDAGLTFWHHCDAAFGGFFASLLPKTDDGDFVPPAQLDDALVGPDGLLPADDAEALATLSATDSITIDPHKFGYVPYPAGAVLFRDYHVRDAIAYKAPYLADEDQSGFGGFLGQWTLEGSRPGAVAVSCYLSQAMVPLTPDGHGRFMENCIRANQQLFEALTERFSAAEGELDLRPFHHPETVAFCFVVTPGPDVESIASLNDYTNRIWQQMTVDGREDINQYAFLLSRTEVDVADYAHILKDLLPADVVREAAERGASLTLLRTCLMNPFQSDWHTDEGSFPEQVADFLYDVALEEYVAHTFPPVPRPDADRHPILVVEQTPRAQEGLARYLEHDEKVVAHFDVRSCSAATLKDLRGRLGEVRDLVLHVDPSAPSQALRIARWLVDEARIDSEHLLAVATQHTNGTDVTARLGELGLPARNVILESDLLTSTRRLVLQLSAQRPAPAGPSS
ncbi:pyridoxal phosphate-dependent decarboxylase family protein [Salinibacter grassmerensis]|uniref:pyridoxal phosphate-dependent decarboxylase family protein n=1 Tax=Salinibacter grassmerensis TaxID=3040353 RepID=UPI0021E96A14|nr:pyridoxal-dependent decarboxylase [Salinibacter grassmerensis]